MKHVFILFLWSILLHPIQAQDAIWQPAPGTTWQWQLSGTINTGWDVEMYDIDMETPQATIDLLHNQGRIVICYFSGGSWENYRADAAAFPPEVLGNTLDGWPDERWLDIRRIDLLAPVMEARLDMAAAKNCDGVEPDNMDGYTNDSGFPLTYADQLAYNKWVAAEAHERGLSVGLKNDLNQIPDLVAHFDFAVNEQCFQYNECETLLPFIEAGKAVFGVEYEGDPLAYCPQAVAFGFSWLTKTLDLGDEAPNACDDFNPPKQPRLIAPVNNAGDVSHAPTFQWVGENADTYKLVIRNANGVIVYRKSLTGAVCNVTDCTFTPDELSLRNATGYKWWVVAKNSQGKARSQRFTFAVEFPGKPVISGVQGSTVTWGEVGAATEYRLRWRSSDGVVTRWDWQPESAVCSGAVCSFMIPAAPGSYLVRVEARAAGVKNRSKSAAISVSF